VAVAVLPFENISADSGDAYLALGLPEMIINRMSQSAQLTVIARNSSFVLPISSIDSREIGRRLNCRFLVAGSVQRDAERLRVTVQVVDAVANTVVWSARFDRKLSEIFDVEDEIGDQVAEAIAARTGGSKPRAPAKERSANVEAYLAFLRGRSLLGRFTVTESQSAIPYFEKAIELDPQFAAAYASLYDARMQAADGHGDDLEPLRDQYRTLIDRSLAIDPTCGAAYFARAMWSHDDPGKRDADFRRAAVLDPSNGRGLTAYADFIENSDPSGRPEDADRMLQRALQIDPMSPLAHFKAAVWSREDSAPTTEVRKRRVMEILERDPNFAPALQRYGQYRWLFDGRIAEAIQYEEHAIAEDPQDAWTRHIVMAMYLDIGDETAARDVVAGTPRSAQTAQLMLALHAGDWRAAGVAAFDNTVWNRDGFWDWGAPEALRDYAAKSGQLQKTLRFMRDRYDLQGEVSRKLTLINFRPALYVSQLLALSESSSEALEMRRAVAAWNDAHEPVFGAVYAERLRAEISLIDGDQDKALLQLADSFRSGDYEDWWYTLEMDPLWRPLHEDPRFRAIVVDVHRYIDTQHEQLEELRRKGQVPYRENPEAVH
jgi:TolB-like protein